MTVREQIERGIIVCPATRKTLLFRDENALATADGLCRYIVAGKVPILLKDRKSAESLLRNSPMVEEYRTLSSTRQRKGTASGLPERILRWYRNDLRSSHCLRAFERLYIGMSDRTVTVAVGGGPCRIHDDITNLNIGMFPNVDVVGDAHDLPYADASVDALYSEAVLEHLISPAAAVAEMHRVLKRGGWAYVITPFLQPYHGYPLHFQSYTRTGHSRLFEEQGFRVQAQGTCVGPGFTLAHMVSFYIRKYLPFPLTLLRYPWALLARTTLREFDRVLNKREDSHEMASTTFVVARKE